MAATPTFRRGDVIARRYQVVTKSGETSLWIGYHGFDKNNQTSAEQKGIPEPDVLIKVVRPELLTESAARSHLSRELQRVRGLQHPGMPRLIDVQPLDEMGTMGLIEPIQSGLSQGVLLRRIVTFRKNEVFQLAEVRQISAQLASALSYIHGQMMCHGDLRLESVILRPDGAKLCDIGLGAALPRGPYLDAVKRAGETELLAPEVRAGKQPDVRSDVFGLASLYRHLISLGQQSAWDAFMAKDGKSAAMAAVLIRGMAEDPGQRYSSIEALIADVEAVALTGAPIRKRLAQTPLAMAVAAGRLPAEELSRPVEELVPESGRSRRNSAADMVGAVLAPLSGGPAAKMSIGTIPASLSSQASSRSGRLVETSSESSTKSKGDAETSSPRNAPVSPSAISKSNRTTMPGRGRIPSPGTADALPPSTRATAAAVSAELEPISTANASGRVVAEGQGDATVPIRTGRRSDPAMSLGGAATAATAEKETVAKALGQAKSHPEGKAQEMPSTESGIPAEGQAIRPRAPSLESDRASDGGSRVAASKQSAGSISSPLPSGSSPRMDRLSMSQQSIPPHMVMASRWALLGALILAAFVGALVAVVVILALRPDYVTPTGPSGPVSPTAPATVPTLPLPSIAPPASPGAASPTGR